MGIIGVQFFWIQNAFNVKEAQFDQSVNEALGNTVSRLETKEDIVYLRNNLVCDSIHTLIQAFANDTIFTLNRKLDSLISNDEFLHQPPPLPPPEPQSVTYEYHIRQNIDRLDSVMKTYEPFAVIDPLSGSFSFEWNGEMDLQKLDSMLRVQEFVFVNPNPIHPGLRSAPKSNRPPFSSRHLSINNRQEKRLEVEDVVLTPPMHNPYPHATKMQDDMRKITNKARKITTVIKKIATELESKPLTVEQRVDTASLKRSLIKSLADKDITLPFEFAVASPGNDTNPIPIHSKGFNAINLSTPYKVSLFPNDIFQKPNQLMIFFPHQRSHLLKSLSVVMLSSLFFTLIIVITSVISIFIMLRQKKISDIKTDFINNMTHEFKTPIATISIAIDSINNPKIIDEPEKIRGFTHIIREENSRMNSRVEQVLQMALLDSKDFMLNPGIVDIHTLLRKVTENFRLQVERREGSLILDLVAERTMVEADEPHLSNVIVNLLDNANKYSTAPPEIRVSTRNLNRSVIVSIQDKGIGMNPDQQHKIFDKFFRVTSGNIHSVKGFGLGLSYAKAIVLAHKGQLNVESEAGKGSRFDVILPLVPEALEIGEEIPGKG